jgi:hypothetical protein
LILLIGLMSLSGRAAFGQAFVLDLSAIPDEYREYFVGVERDLNTRIQDYSNELPRALLFNLDKLYIVARLQAAGPDVLGFASPSGVVRMEVTNPRNRLLKRPLVVPVAGTITINSDLIDQMIADETLVPTIAHEILHVFGFGSLWGANQLTGPASSAGPVTVPGDPTGVGLTQYIGGKYAIQQYRIETSNPFAAFVPLEQFGGAGTALSHWSDEPPFFNQTFTPAFRKELMTGFACDVVPDDGTVVCPPTFFSMTTEGALADLGFAMFKINPNSSPPPKNLANRNWPKIVGTQLDPFAGPPGRFNTGLTFSRVNIVRVYKSNKAAAGGVNAEEPGPRAEDPFNLRDLNWARNN